MPIVTPAAAQAAHMATASATIRASGFSHRRCRRGGGCEGLLVVTFVGRGDVYDIDVGQIEELVKRAASGRHLPFGREVFGPLA